MAAISVEYRRVLTLLVVLAMVGWLLTPIGGTLAVDAAPTENDDVTIDLGTAEGEQNETVSVELTAAADEVAGYEANITYDPDVASFDSAEGVDIDVGEQNTSDGWVHLTGSEANGTDDPHIANISFELVGEKGDTTGLTFVEVNTSLNNETSLLDIDQYDHGALEIIDDEPADVTATAINDTATADGEDELEFEVEVTNEAGDPLEDVTVAADHDGTDVDFHDDEKDTAAGGNVTFFATSTEVQEDVEFNFTEQDNEHSDTAIGSFVTGDVDRVEIDPGDAQTIGAGDEIDFSATAFDEEDNVVEDDDAAFTWDAEDGSISDDGLFDETDADDYDVTAELDGVTSEATTVTVEPGEVETVEIDPDEDQTITAGDELEFSATAYDEYDNVVEDDDTEFAWDAEDGWIGDDGLFNETDTGSYNVSASYDDEVSSENTTVTVEPGDVDRVELDPADDQTIEAGDEIDFSATAYDAEDNVVEDDDGEFTWEAAEDGSITGEGLFDETESGSYNVSASYGDGVRSENTTVTVEPGDAGAIDVEAITETAVADGEEELEFEATVTDEHGNEIEGVAVNATHDGDDIAFDAAENVTDDEGQVTFSATSIVAQEDVDFTFQELDNNNSDTATATFVPGPVEDVLLEHEGEEAVAEAGQPFEFDATAVDGHDNVIEDDDSEFDWSWEADGVDEAAVDLEDGVFNATVATLYDVTANYTDDRWDPVETAANTTELTVEPGPPDRVNLTPENVTITAGEETDFSAEAFDEFDNTVEDDDAEFDWDAEGASISETGLFDETRAGTYTVTANYSENGETSTLGDDVVTGEASAETEPGDPQHVEATADPDVAVANASDELVFAVNVTDDFDNTPGGVNVTVDHDGSEEIEFDEDEKVTEAGENLTFTANSTVAEEDVEFTFTEQNNSNYDTTLGTFEPGPPAEVTATVEDDVAWADGEDALAFDVVVEDEFENAVPDVPVNASTEDGQDIEFDAEQAVTDADGAVNFEATSETAQEDVEFTFTEQNESTSDSVTATFRPDPANVTVSVVEDNATADGDDELRFEVNVTDDDGVGAWDIEVAAEHAGEDIDFDADSKETDDEGLVRFNATSTTAQDDIEFTFTEQRNDNNDTVAGTFEAGEPAQVTATTVDDTAVADGEDELEFAVEVTDAEGNAVENVTVEAEHDGTDIDFDADSKETGADGNVTFFATSTEVQEDVEFTFTEQVNENEDAALGSFVAEDPAQVIATAIEDTATADGEDELEFEVEVLDDEDNPVENVTVEAEHDGEDIALDAVSKETGADGTVTFNATSTVAQENVTFTFAETINQNEDAALGTFEAGEPAHVTATAVEETATADGTDELVFEIQVVDANDNPVEDVTVTAADNGTDIDFDEDSKETGADGNVTFFATSTVAQEDVEFGFVEQDNFNADDATGTFEAGEPAQVTATAVEDTATADGDDELEFEFEVTDDQGNAVENVTVEAAHDGEAIAFDADSKETGADGNVTFFATSTVAQEDVAFTFTEQVNENEDTALGTFEAGEPAQVTATAVEDTATADGEDELEFAVEVVDAQGNAVENVTVEAEHDGTDIDFDADSKETAEDGNVTFFATSTEAQEDVEFTFEEQDNENVDTAMGTFEDQPFFAVDIDEDESDDEVEEGENLTIVAVIENTGDENDTQEIDLLDFDDNVTATEEVNLSASENTTVELDWETEEGDAGEGNVTVESDDDDDTHEVTIEEEDAAAPPPPPPPDDDEPATFALNLVDIDESVTAGETVTVEVEVINEGDEEGSDVIRLLKDDDPPQDAVDSEEVTLGGGGETTVVLEWQTDADDVGDQLLRVTSSDAELQETVTVESDDVDPPEPDRELEVEIRDADQQVTAGEDVEIPVRVINDDEDTAVEGEVVLAWNGEEIDSETVEVEPEDFESVVFTVPTDVDDVGDHVFEVSVHDSVDSLAVTVEAPDEDDVEEPDEDEGIGLAMPLLLVMLVLLAIAAVVGWRLKDSELDPTVEWRGDRGW